MRNGSNVKAQSAAAPATVTGEVRHNATGVIREGWLTNRHRPDIRKPGDLPAQKTETGRGVSVSGSQQSVPCAPVPEKGLTMMTEAIAPVELLVCTTCRAGQPTDVEGPRPGTQLYDALDAADLPDNVTLKGVECFSNCDQGCSITLRGGAARWTYVYGNFTGAEDVELVAEGVSKYAATADGLVPWRERSTHFRKNCIARIPPQEADQ